MWLLKYIAALCNFELPSPVGGECFIPVCSFAFSGCWLPALGFTSTKSICAVEGEAGNTKHSDKSLWVLLSHETFLHILSPSLLTIEQMGASISYNLIINSCGHIYNFASTNRFFPFWQLEWCLMFQGYEGFFVSLVTLFFRVVSISVSVCSLYYFSVSNKHLNKAVGILSPVGCICFPLLLGVLYTDF